MQWGIHLRDLQRYFRGLNMWWNILNNFNIWHFILPVIGFVLAIIGLITIIKWIF